MAMNEWHGYTMKEFSFEGKEARIIFPKEANSTRSWMLKTEYFGAFPNTEITLLKKGYHLAFIRNNNRWGTDVDLDRKYRFIKFIQEEYQLAKMCVLIGMSCGGTIGVKFAAKYPEKVSLLYLDAPVMNFLSCPAAIGRSQKPLYEEFYEATHITLAELLNYRQHPVDLMGILLENKIPILLVCDKNDTIVPYEENGKQLFDFYSRNNGNIKLILKESTGHHPHGLENPEEMVNFIIQNER